jgi:DNA invertase Pin-like site-specific DNA recombinase
LTRYVAYFRVSTAGQGRSGLGLAAQRSTIEQFLCPADHVVAEFVEIQSGKSDKREELWKAIASAKKHGAKLTCSPDCYHSEVESGSFMMVG